MHPEKPCTTLALHQAKRRLPAACEAPRERQHVHRFQAAHDYFTLKLAGFRPILYGGSFAEWSSTPGTQVDTAGK
jgi:3-mercaptopyruvate sulfurtransferase SseA